MRPLVSAKSAPRQPFPPLLKQKLFLLIIVASACAGPCGYAGVVGGTSVNPAQYGGSYATVTLSRQEAVPFTVASGGPFQVDAIQAPLWLASTVTNVLFLSIASDAGGLPGASLGNFQAALLTTTPQVVTVPSQDHMNLESGAKYWVVASVPAGQVNWYNLQSQLGPNAYDLNGGGWTLRPSANLRSFVVLGSTVPEPGIFSLLALGTALFHGKFFKRI